MSFIPVVLPAELYEFKSTLLTKDKLLWLILRLLDNQGIIIKLAVSDYKQRAHTA